ncbi:MAG: cobalamin B12-binding domain-containing protein [Chloroflexota bacterium]
MSEKKKIRILLGKVGLDGHDRGVLVIAQSLRDAGMEVIYTGRHLTADQLVAAAVQEDVDVVGLSLLNDAHRTMVPRILKLLKEKGRGDVMFLLGGFIPEEDVPEMKKMGVAEVFSVGTKLATVVSFIQDNISKYAS